MVDSGGIQGTLSEAYGVCGSGGSVSRSYMIVGDTVRMRKSGKGRNTRGGFYDRMSGTLREVFLPQGYPESVSEDYLSYQMWDTLQAFCSYITGTLATHAMLKGAGVGDSSASPVAATLTWILKDGLGMIGRILFAWLRGSDLDCNAKKWRLVADILNDIAICIEIMTPFFPSIFLLLACIASVTKSLVGVAGGATRAALVQHQARRDNMADVSAKDGSQETLVNLAGLIIGLIITPIVAGRNALVWLLFSVFTFLHLFSNYRAVSVVSMETLNRNRLHLLMKHLFTNGEVPNPKLINLQEPLLLEPKRHLVVEYGVCLADVLIHSNDYARSLSQYERGQKFILHLSRSQRKVNVAFNSESTPPDQLQAGMTIELLDYVCSGSHGESHYLRDYDVQIRKGLQDSDDSSLVDACQSIIKDLFPSLVSQLQRAGWVTGHHLLGLKEWRYTVN